MTIDQYVASIYYILCSKELGHTKSKSPMDTVFYVSTPFLLVMAAALADDPKSCFDAAKNQEAGSLGVGANRYLAILCVSKPLWV